ncbi:MAG TPA: hypothetical protein PKD78_00180 [Saprospiraceae bacterium]|nr:hypothetical protein [Saprospiraceae bacterium]
MKHLFFSLMLLIGCNTAAFAQFEIKGNPIALLFETVALSAEYSNLDDWGGQADLFTVDGFGFLYATGKYYLSPKYGADRFHVGAFLGSAFGDGEGNVGIGFMAGYKVMSPKRLIFEIGAGVGRGFAGEDDDLSVLPYFNLNLGYRFLEAKNRAKVKG